LDCGQTAQVRLGRRNGPPGSLGLVGDRCSGRRPDTQQDINKSLCLRRDTGWPNARAEAGKVYKSLPPQSNTRGNNSLGINNKFYDFYSFSAGPPA
jgi:hypothetical protein